MLHAKLPKNRRDPLWWSRLNANGAAQVRASAQRVARLARLISFSCVLLMAAGLGWLTFWLAQRFGWRSQFDLASTVLTTGGLVLVMAAVARAGDLVYAACGGYEAMNWTRLLRPLKKDIRRSAKALRMAAENPDVQAYRERVLKVRPQLLLGDYLCMQELALWAPSDGRDTDEALDDYRALHGFKTHRPAT